MQQYSSLEQLYQEYLETFILQRTLTVDAWYYNPGLATLSISLEIRTSQEYLEQKIALALNAAPQQISTETINVKGKIQGIRIRLIDANNTLQRGQVYTVVQESFNNLTRMIAAGYITSYQTLTLGQIERPFTGPGALLPYTGANPAAGAEISQIIPDHSRWRILTCLMTLITDANVANRQVRFSFGPGAAVYNFAIALSTQAASLTRQYIVAPLGFDRAAENDLYHINIPPLIMKDNDVITSITASLQVGDNWAAPLYYVEWWVGPSP